MNGVWVYWLTDHMFGVSSRAVSKCPRRRRVGDEGLDCPITQMDEKVGKNEIQYVAKKLVRSTVDFFKKASIVMQ